MSAVALLKALGGAFRRVARPKVQAARERGAIEYQVTRRGRPGKTVVITRSQSPYEDRTMLGAPRIARRGRIGSTGTDRLPYVEISRPRTTILPSSLRLARRPGCVDHAGWGRLHKSREAPCFVEKRAFKPTVR
jgi:hypothetical protein